MMAEKLKFLLLKLPGIAAIFLLFTTSLIVHMALITRFSFDIWGRDWFSLVYNTLAQSLLKGDASVSSAHAAWEGYTSNGRTVVYFGIFPALLRMPLALAGEASLAVNRLSCLVASLIFAIGSAFLFCQASQEKKLNSTSRQLLAIILFGSPALFLSFWGAIYHECFWWALASSCWALVSISSALRRGSFSIRDSRLLGATSAICMCSRITFALPLIACACWLLARQLQSEGFKSTSRAAVAWLTPLLIGIVLCGWYNNNRYGSWLEFAPPPDSHYLQVTKMGGNFNVRRIPSNALSYLAPTLLPFSSAAPYISAYPPKYFPPDMFFETSEDVVSLMVVCPLLIVLAIIAFLNALLNRRLHELMIITFFAAQALLIMSYYAAHIRYTAEFMPLFLISTVLVLEHGTLRMPPALLSAFVCWSICACITIGIVWEMKWRYQRADIGARVLSIFIRPQVRCSFSPEVFSSYRDSSILGSDSQFECIPLTN